MKKLLIASAALVASVLPCRASEIAYDQNLVNQVVTTTTSFTLNLNAYGIDALSFQVTVASATPQTQTFSDGKQSTGTITVVSTAPLIATSASDTITIPTSSNTFLSPTSGTQSILVSSNGATALSFATITINGMMIYSTNTATPNYAVGASSNATAINIAAAINGSIPNIVAAVSPVGGGTVTLTCVNAGSFCNSYTVQTSTIALLLAKGTTAQSNFTGGNDNAVITLISDVRTHQFVQGADWFQQDVASNTAISIMNDINNNTAAFTASTPTSNSISIKRVLTGSKGNNFTLSASTGALKVTSLNFTGGQDNAFLIINGVIGVQGTDWTQVPTTTGTAKSISDWITGNTILNKIIVSTWTSGGVVAATGTINLTGNNYSWFSSTQTALKVSNSGLFGGTTSGYLINTPLISLPSHTLATGEEVLFTSGTVALAPLTNQTSYYAIVVDVNDIELALTSTGAIAGMYITLTSSSTSGAHTFTLTPLALSGTNVVTFAASNDGVNFSTPTVTATNVTIPVNALSTPWAPITYGYDFGNVAYQYIRVTISGPGTAGNGGINTVVAGNGKRYWR